MRTSNGCAAVRCGLLMIALALVGSRGPSVSAAGMPPLDLTRAKPASASGMSSGGRVAIKGKVFEGYLCGYSGRDFNWATWSIPAGYTTLDAYAGVNDEWETDRPVLFNVLVDGDVVKSVKARFGDKPVRLSVPVPGGASLRLEIVGYGGVFAEPKVLAGASASPGAPAETRQTPAPSAPFVVDPRDLDKLAANLWQKTSANPTARRRLETGQVAVATFELIDVPSPSVARNVAEDLYTAMINAGYQLVERGQLDKVLKELKIQNMGLIDPKTAQRIGQLSGCDVILLGSISDRGQFVAINARLMDTATGKSLVADRVEMRKMPIER